MRGDLGASVVLLDRDDVKDLEPLMLIKGRLLPGEGSACTEMSSPEQELGNEQTTDIIKTIKHKETTPSRRRQRMEECWRGVQKRENGGSLERRRSSLYRLFEFLR